jgi:hypothetical protein
MNRGEGLCLGARGEGLGARGEGRGARGEGLGARGELFYPQITLMTQIFF